MCMHVFPCVYLIYNINVKLVQLDIDSKSHLNLLFTSRFTVKNLGECKTLILTRIYGRQSTTSEFAINQAKAQSKQKLS